MIFELIQSILQTYSMPFLYAIVAWFGIVGFVGRLAIVMILTRMNSMQIAPVSWKLHLISLVISYLTAPIYAVLSIALSGMFLTSSILTGIGPNVYLWYSLIMILTIRYLACKTFVSVSCSTWQAALLAIDSFIAILGYFFLQALHVW